MVNKKLVQKELLQKIIDTANIIHTTNIRGDNNYVITSRDFAEAINTIIKRQERRNKIKKLREE
jgi:hypothetical protein